MEEIESCSIKNPFIVNVFLVFSLIKEKLYYVEQNQELTLCIDLFTSFLKMLQQGVLQQLVLIGNGIKLVLW